MPEAATAKPPSTNEQYLARVDAHVATLPAASRLTFLQRELARLESAYQDFQRDVMLDRYTGTRDAADFVIVITSLDSRVRAQARKQAVDAALSQFTGARS